MENENLKKNINLIRQIKCSGIFTPEECLKIISLGNNFPQIQARIEGSVINQEIRETKVRHLLLTKETHWLWDRINRCIMQTNGLYYQFDLVPLSELQLLEYDEGCFYDWHMDITGGESTCTRKISIIAFLSNTGDYEGGQLNMDLMAAQKPQLLPVEQGSMVLFPSFHPHKVMPVTRGKRFTLVGWAHGNAFS